MDIPKPVPLRSHRESLGGYILLPRLIDKVRLLAQGQLPQACAANVLKAGLTLDGRFLTFTGLNAETLRQAILSSPQMMRDACLSKVGSEHGSRMRREQAPPYSHPWALKAISQMAGLTL